MLNPRGKCQARGRTYAGVDSGLNFSTEPRFFLKEEVYGRARCNREDHATGWNLQFQNGRRCN